jgi:DCN1-like protein 1/2
MPKQKSYVWQYDEGGWTLYDPQVSEALEDVYARNPRGQVDIRINYSAFSIDMCAMKQKNRRSGSTCSIRRIEDLSEKERLEKELELQVATFVSGNAKSLAATFKSLADLSEDDTTEIQDEGVEKFCEELGIDPEDAVILVISYYMKAENMCIYTEDEFNRGFGHLQCTDLKEMKGMIPQLREQLDDEDMFAEIYEYAYNFCKEKGKKSLDADSAKAMWGVLYVNRWDWLDKWLAFLETYNTPIKKDEWNMLKLFIATVGTNLVSFCA